MGEKRLAGAPALIVPVAKHLRLLADASPWFRSLASRTAVKLYHCLQASVYELYSKLLVSPLISPILVPYITPH